MPLRGTERYKGAHGGRGSGKSHDRAEAVVERCFSYPGQRILCCRQVQKSLRESAMQLIRDKIDQLQAPGFEVLNTLIRTPGDGVIVFEGLQTHNADTIKSYEAFDVAWAEEAHKLRQGPLDLLRPTIRKPAMDNKPAAELWFTWNPTRHSDPVDQFFRGENAKERIEAGRLAVVEANWRDNPWFPKDLDDDRRDDERNSPETYQHIWEGAYATVVSGAYYAAGLAAALAQGRVTQLAPDPMCEIKAAWDLGVSDATSIWIAQFVGKQIWLLDYIEGEGQPLSYYVAELRERGWEKALCILPHDGARRDSVSAIRFEDHLKDAGFRTKTIANQGQGAARLRIEAMRRLFPRMWFDQAKTEAGREALGAYHERRNDDREVGLGPEHDWASHGADAAGLLAIAYEEPRAHSPAPSRVRTIESGSQNTAWMRG